MGIKMGCEEGGREIERGGIERREGERESGRGVEGKW
jgi:hypothetical protein